jgi:hypothetical protein
MTIKMFLAAAATLALLSGGVAQAQTAAPAAKTEAAGKVKAPRTAKSLECSKEADAKGLHGKERKKFRSKCKRG